MNNKYTNDLESVENFELAKLDNFVGWHCHHRLETHFSDGTHRPVEARLTMSELVALGLYYDRPAEELIFMRAADHKRLHQLGVKYGSLTKLKHSIQMLGNKHNVGRHLSEEIKAKISKSHMGIKHTEEAKLKMSKAKRSK